MAAMSFTFGDLKIDKESIKVPLQNVSRSLAQCGRWPGTGLCPYHDVCVHNNSVRTKLSFCGRNLVSVMGRGRTEMETTWLSHQVKPGVKCQTIPRFSQFANRLGEIL
ncbi:hypothetical protein Bbelb_005970 [Branchiostoma belcheri]|nr:hypothetical protein Bbelb_005970 [Branchiostoma belcheri]